MLKKVLIITFTILSAVFTTAFADDTTAWPSETSSEVILDGEVSDDTVKPIDSSSAELENIAPVFTEKDNSLLKDDSNYAGVKDILPEVTTDQILEWGNRKGYEIIHLLQVIVQPISIIFFILGALLMLVGSIGRGDLGGKGFYTMLIAGITYALVLYAPVILQVFAGWLTN